MCSDTASVASQAVPTQQPRKRVQVSDEDRRRMSSLIEEVRGRMDQMGHIVARNLDLGPSFSVARFTLDAGKSTAGTTHIEMEPTIVIGDGKGCYQDPPGICCECPC